MYEFDAKIRFSEVDQDGKLSITGLLNYFQDCSTFQSEELGIGVKYLSKENKAWVINAWQIDVLRMPELCDEVIVGTIPYAIKGFMGSRNFYMKDKKTGDMIAKANSIWTFLDLEKLRPVRVEPGIAELYGIEDKLDMVADWSHVLSIGEQQRLAFVRAHIQQPIWLFLDEATSALDEETEARMYELLAERLPSTTVVSVGHRSTLNHYHKLVLRLDKKAHSVNLEKL